MKAFEARKKYFEFYVEYEHNIRKIARHFIIDYSTKGKSLRNIILDLAKWNSRNKLKLNIKKFFYHRKVRNWLAHTPKSTLAPSKYINLMIDIENFNQNIIKIIKNK